MWSRGENERGLESHALLASLFHALGRRTQTSVVGSATPSALAAKFSISMADQVLTVRITDGRELHDYRDLPLQAMERLTGNDRND